MREFALFRQYLEDVSLKKGKYPLKKLMDFPGSSCLWKSGEEDIVKEGELELVSEIQEFREFDITFKYRRRKTQISDESLIETGKFKLWQHKRGLAVAIDSPRLLSNVAASFLSVVQYNELKAIKPLEMNTKEFLALRKHAIELDGKVTMLHLKNVESNNIKLSVFQVHGNDLEKMDVEKMLIGAKKIKRVGFSIPNLMGESYSFWVADWGGGAIYKPTELLPHQIAGILEFFEDSLLLHKTK
jgi:hypothetical protein